MNGPDIAVLYTTYNRAALLRRSLESMTGQTLDRERFEVIVVDDGSEDDTREIVHAFQDALPLTYVHQENRGIAAGKNRAIEHASAPIVLFMDDDDAAAPDLLAQHLLTHRQHPRDAVAVLGYTDLAPEVARQPLMHYVARVGNYMFAYSDLAQGEQLGFTHFWGGRSSCKRSFLERHGLFDEDFRFGSEDIELGYRLARHGLEVIYNRDAVSTMMRGMSLRAYARRIYAQGRSNWVFAQKHPDRAVAALCGVDHLAADWDAARSRLPLHQRIASELEALYEARAEAGLAPDNALVWLLHRHYALVLEGYRLKGSWDASREGAT